MVKSLRITRFAKTLSVTKRTRNSLEIFRWHNLSSVLFTRYYFEIQMILNIVCQVEKLCVTLCLSCLNTIVCDRAFFRISDFGPMLTYRSCSFVCPEFFSKSALRIDFSDFELGAGSTNSGLSVCLTGFSWSDIGPLHWKVL